MLETHRKGTPRITTGHELWGRLCECGNLKGFQARVCRQCYLDELRDDAYWQRRTCGRCGGPKDRGREKCRRCENESRIGVSVMGRPQPEEHPWRKL